MAFGILIALYCLNPGASIKKYSRLGHGDIHTTIYAHVTEKQRERLAERFSYSISI